MSAHDVITFSPHGKGLPPTLGYDLGTTFDSILAQLPAGWQPHLVIFWMPEYQYVPHGVENCPYPTVLAISDWNMGLDSLIDVAGMFDLTVCDKSGSQMLQEAGVRAAWTPLYGYDPRCHRHHPEEPTQWDVIMVGSLTHMVRPERMRTLELVGQLAGRYRVGFFSDVTDTDTYGRLASSSRIIVNRTARGEMNMRCYEALACRSLLFVEDTNVEVRDFLTEGQDCVIYNDGNIQRLLTHYLEDAPAREAIAAAGHDRIQPYTYAAQMERLIALATDTIQGPHRPFLQQSEQRRHSVRALQAYSQMYDHVAQYALEEAEQALAHSPHDPHLNHLVGCCAAAATEQSADAARRAHHYQRSHEAFEAAKPLGQMVYLSQAMLRMKSGVDALDLLRDALRQPFVELPFYPRQGEFVCAWERYRTAAHRQSLTRWRIHDLLADLVPQDRVEHLRAATTAYSDIGETWLRLAQALPAGAEAEAALRRAFESSPQLVTPRLELIRSLWQRGQKGEALQQAQRAAQMLTAFPYPAVEMERLHALLANLRQNRQSSPAAAGRP